MNFSQTFYKLFFFLILCFCFKISTAQYAEKIASGRPGQANDPFSVGKGIYQIQSGLDFINVESDFGNRETELSAWNQNSLIRLGIFERFEVRIGYGYQIREQFSTNITTEFPEEQSGFNAFQFGLRHNIIMQKGIIPTIGIQFTTRFGGLNVYRQNRFSYEGKLLLQHKISEKLVLNTNFSLEYNDQVDYTFGRYVFSFAYSLTDRLSVLAEAYGIVDSNDFYLFFDGGFGYLLSNNLQLDIFGGYGNNKIGGENSKIESYFVSLGFSYRINTRD